MERSLQLAIIIGSTREGRFGPRVTRWFATMARDHGRFDVDLIDLAYTEWQAKPVAFASYGGLAGGLRAVEQLRQVFAEVHATTVRDVVSLHNPWTLFDEDARAHEPTGSEAAAKTLLDRLAWWAGALRAARDSVPYAA